MILLLGASGYFGRAFAAELRRRGHSFIPLSREAFDYTRFDFLFDYLRTMRPEFVINAAGYTGKAEQDGLGEGREKAMLANALLPQMIARVCLMTKTPWGHVSSGSIYTGAKIVEGAGTREEPNLATLEMEQQFESHPELFLGFKETDEPNFSFRNPSCSFYAGTKALAEEAIRDIGHSYIWRPRHPFSENQDPCNYLLMLERQAKLSHGVNSLSHLNDCVRACLDLWEIHAPYGIYNVTNPGAVSTRELVELMQRTVCPQRRFEFLTERELQDLATDGKVQPDCILDVSKLLAAGVKLRPSSEALDETMSRARVNPSASRMFDKPRRLPPAASA